MIEFFCFSLSCCESMKNLILRKGRRFVLVITARFRLLQLPEVEEAPPILGWTESCRGKEEGARSCLDGISCHRMRELCKWLEPMRDVQIALKHAAATSQKKMKKEEEEESLKQLTEIGIAHVEQLVYFMKHRLEQFGARFVLEAPGYDTFC